ncbi:MMPL family transporter [Vallitalea pronyensis]|uniref:MMPL family transporter n=1 Tax=Vallitalea pronyensis TaxID=1348613 RepID=A0A8J8MJ50_9FIRM|nr:MMPL family transporter [Vallitalea pronyensis]QUI22387.1 MMPL family transporter [Vallitalea pronyensis]
MVEKLMAKNVEWVTQRPKTILAIALCLTVFMGIFASFLDLELNWVALAPKGNSAVKEYQKIVEDFPTLSNIMVVIESDDRHQLEEVTEIVHKELSQLTDYISSVSAGIDEAFALENGLLYVPTKEIEMMGYALMDTNLDSFYGMLEMTIDESIKGIEEGQLSSKDIAYQVANYDAMMALFQVTNKGLKGGSSEEELRQAITKFFTGNTRAVSPDGKAVIVTVQPNFDIMDMEQVVPGVNTIEETIKAIDANHKDVRVRATGMHVVVRDEMASIESDSLLTTLLSILLILAILYFAFRSFLAPIITFIPLVLGIIWAVGLTKLTIGRLNMMTAFSAAMLLGLGIDYAIHLYSSYTEKRAYGLEKQEAIKGAISITGLGIITGALTTAVAFLALNISSLEILQELGTIMGTGILTTLIAVFWVLPAIIMINKEKPHKVSKIKGQYHWIGHIAVKVNQVKVPVIIGLLLLTSFMAYKAKNVTFDTNLMHLEPEGLESIALMEHLVEQYDMSTDSFSIEVSELADVYELHEAYEQVNGVAKVSSIADIVPKEMQQHTKLEAIDKTRTMLSQQVPHRSIPHGTLIDQLENIKKKIASYEKSWSTTGYRNLTEGDFVTMATTIDDLIKTLKYAPKTNVDQLSEEFYNLYKAIGHHMLVTEPLTVEGLPQDLKKQFVSEDGSMYLLTIYPDFSIWDHLDSEKGNTFFKALTDIDATITGTPIFMRVLYQSASDEMALTGVVVFAILFLILFLHFRHIKYTLLAFLPLMFTMVYTVGMMVLIDLPFNVLNFLSILLLIGIGIDDGVHILHHYKSGERNIFKLFSSVGRAILLTTITTMCGFGSLMFSSYVGIASLGKVLFIGVSLAFILTVVVLPLFLKNIEDTE